MTTCLVGEGKKQPKEKETALFREIKWGLKGWSQQLPEELFLRKCISILPGITLSEKRAAGASRFVLAERGSCLLSIQPIRTLTNSTQGISLIKGSSKCCRVLAEGYWQRLLSWLSAGVHTPLFLGWAKTKIKVQLALPPTLSHGENMVQVGFTPATAMISDAKPAWLLQGLVSTL